MVAIGHKDAYWSSLPLQQNMRSWKSIPKSLHNWRFRVWHKIGHSQYKKFPSKEAIRDLRWWKNCLSQWKGRAIMFQRAREVSESNVKTIWFLDASPLYGIGVWSPAQGTWGNLLPDSILDFCS